MPRVVAACSRVRPPKKRSSTSFALSGSWRANSSSASCKARSSSVDPSARRSSSSAYSRRAPAAVLLAALSAGVLDQDAPHRLGRGGEEMAPTVPLPVVGRPDEPYVSLVNQGGGLKRLPGSLLGQSMCGQLAELVVDERQELVGRPCVAFLDGRKDAGDLVHIGPEPRGCLWRS